MGFTGNISKVTLHPRASCGTNIAVWRVGTNSSVSRAVSVDASATVNVATDRPFTLKSPDGGNVRHADEEFTRPRENHQPPGTDGL